MLPRYEPDSHLQPRWPPHAKSHNGQTLSMSLLRGGLTAFLACWPSNNVPAMVAATACAASLYFISQSTAILYPNTAYFDPEFKPQTVRGVPLALVIDVVYLSAVVIASWFGFRGVRCNPIRHSWMPNTPTHIGYSSLFFWDPCPHGPVVACLLYLAWHHKPVIRESDSCRKSSEIVKTDT